MIFFAYILKSKREEYFYKGHCADMQERLIQHNSGATISIKKYLPFEIVYLETFPTREEAIRRENYFKSAAGRKFLKSKLSLQNNPVS